VASLFSQKTKTIINGRSHVIEQGRGSGYFRKLFGDQQKTGSQLLAVSVRYLESSGRFSVAGRRASLLH
jgi:hypothetical protein